MCDAHPEHIRKTEAIRDGRMALERGRAGYMRVALSEMGAVRLAFCAFQSPVPKKADLKRIEQVANLYPLVSGDTL